MARTAQINYQRITFSFPEKVVKILHEKVDKNHMSRYVANLVGDDLSTQVEDVDDFINSLKEFAENVKRKDTRNSLEILREIRYGKKY